MTEESEIRLGILKQAAECKEGGLGWQDAVHNDIAARLIIEDYVRGEVTAGGTAVITGIWDKGREEIERHSASGRAKRFSKRLIILVWAAGVAAAAYLLQLDAVKNRLSALIDSILK